MDALISQLHYPNEVFRGDYSVSFDRFGHYLIVRLSDCASIYLQGDDARTFHDEFKGSLSPTVLNHVCSQYDSVMEF